MTVNGVWTTCKSSFPRRSICRQTRRSRFTSKVLARSCKIPRAQASAKAEANIASIVAKTNYTLAPESWSSTADLDSGANAPCENVTPTAKPSRSSLCSVIEEALSKGVMSSSPMRPPPPSTPPPASPLVSAPPLPQSPSAELPSEFVFAALQVGAERAGYPSALRAPAASPSTPFLEHATTLKHCQRRVQFDLDNVEVHEVVAYSMLYGIHPREFVFDKQFHMVPAEGCTSMRAGIVEADDDSSDTSASDSEECCDDDLEDVALLTWNIVFH